MNSVCNIIFQSNGGTQPMATPLSPSKQNHTYIIMLKPHFTTIGNIAMVYRFEFNKKYEKYTNYILHLFNQEIEPILILDEYFTPISEETIDMLLITGGFYGYFHRDCSKMMEYYDVASGLGSVEATIILANIHAKINKNSDVSKKYFELACKSGNCEAIYSYAQHLYNNNKLEESEKYFELALNKNNSGCGNISAITFTYAIEMCHTPIEKLELLKKCVKLYENGNAMLELGKIYGIIGDFEQTKYWFERATLVGNQFGYTCLANNYFSQYECALDAKRQTDAITHYNKMMSVLQEGAEHNHIRSILELSAIYFKHERNEEAITLLEQGVKLNSINAIEDLANYYAKKGDEDKYVFYMEKAVLLNDDDCICSLASYHKKKKNYTRMKELYLHAISIYSTNASAQLANYYETVERNSELMKQYHMICLENYNLGQEINCNAIFGKYKPIELFLMLSGIKHKNALVLKKISELRNMKIINHYHNKIALSEKFEIITETCMICHDENKKALPFDCAHLCCIDCYVKVSVCPICKE